MCAQTSDRTARAIKNAGVFYLVSHYYHHHTKKDEVITPQMARIPLLASLHALEFSPLPIRTLLGAKGFAAIAAHIHVRFGSDALNSFYFWHSFQIARAMLKYSADSGAENGTGAPLDELERWAGAVGLGAVLATAFSDLRALQELAGKGHAEAWTGALRIMDEQVEARASEHLQAVDRFESGSTHIPGLSYPEVYRLAALSGRLRASTIVGWATLSSGHEILRVGYELLAIMERLGVVQSLPPGLPSVRKGLQRLSDLGELPADNLSETFLWLESFLGIVFGRKTDKIHRAAYEAECLAGLAPIADQARDLVETALAGFLEAAKELGGGPDEVVSKSIGRVLDSPGRYDVRKEESERVRAAVATWLEQLLLMNGIESFIPERIVSL